MPKSIRRGKRKNGGLAITLANLATAMATLQAPEASPALRILWPEVAPDEQTRLDPESAIMAEQKAKVFRTYVKYKSVRRTAEVLAAEAGREGAPSPVHFTTIGRYVREVVDNYRLIQLQDAATNAAMMLGKYVTLETELWEMLERSKGEFVETSTVRRNTQNGTNDTASVKKKQGIGNVKIAAAIQNCLDKQSQLLGLVDKLTNGKGMDGVPATKLVAGVEKDPMELV